MIILVLLTAREYVDNLCLSTSHMTIFYPELLSGLLGPWPSLSIYELYWYSEYLELIYSFGLESSFIWQREGVLVRFFLVDLISLYTQAISQQQFQHRILVS